MDNDLNMELRSEVLGYSLQLEKSINDLILINLGIFNDAKTRLFGNNGNITFKNKIDLLYDIDVLSKEENAELELLMVFRNKFLHVVECNSFSSIFKNLDSSFKRKFKAFLDEGETIENEKACRSALSKLQLKNLTTILDKISNKLKKSNERHEIIQITNQLLVCHIDIFYDLIGDINRIIHDSELENENVRKLGELISNKCRYYSQKISNDTEVTNLRNRYIEFFTNEDKVKNLYGLKRIDIELNNA